MAQPYYGFTTTTTLDDTALMLWRNLGENNNISFSAFKSLLFTGPTITGNLNFTGTGNRITGDFSNATLANRTMFQTSTVNGATALYAIPNGTGTSSTLRLHNSTDLSVAGYITVSVDTTQAYIRSGQYGSNTLLPLAMQINTTNHLLLSTNGNIVVKTAAAQADDDGSAKLQVTGGILERGAGLIGYGTGSGGTVTQATSKSTAVTLNKASGQIAMNNAALAAGALVSFTLNNSLLGIKDTIQVNIVETIASGNYIVSAGVGTAAATINLRNMSAGPLSETVVLNFTIIKGTNS